MSPLDVECPTCGAEIGNDCKAQGVSVYGTMQWFPCEFHETRRNEARRHEHLDRVVALAKALPIDEEADRIATKAMNEAMTKRGPGRKLVPAPDWPDTLAANLAIGDALCQADRIAWNRGTRYPSNGRDKTEWRPGCGFPCPGYRPARPEGGR